MEDGTLFEGIFKDGIAVEEKKSKPSKSNNSPFPFGRKNLAQENYSKELYSLEEEN